jgi:hypothetical protein
MTLVLSLIFSYLKNEKETGTRTKKIKNTGNAVKHYIQYLIEKQRPHANKHSHTQTHTHTHTVSSIHNTHTAHSEYCTPHKSHSFDKSILHLIGVGLIP